MSGRLMTLVLAGRTLVFPVFFLSVFAFMATPAAAIPITASNSTSVAIPDGLGPEVAGPTVTSTITFGVSGIINDLTITTALDHTFVGDLVIRLVHGSTSIDLLSRPTNGGGGYSGNFVASAPITFDDDASTSIMNLPAGCPACGTVYRPVNPLSTFDGVDILGTWTLQISDHFYGDSGQLSGFRIDADITPIDTPTAVPEPATITLLGLGLLGVARHRRRVSDGSRRTNGTGRVGDVSPENDGSRKQRNAGHDGPQSANAHPRTPGSAHALAAP